MKNSKNEIDYHIDDTRVYRGVTIGRNRGVKTGEAGCYIVKMRQCTSIEDAQTYIDEMIEACGIEFFNSRNNVLHDESVPTL